MAPIASLAARVAVAPRVASARRSSLARGRAAVAVRASGQPAMRPYTLRKGDTLETIAQKRGMSVDEIRKCNATKGSEIKVGETILLPAG